MTHATLLVELFCEELPPKALKRMGDAFAEALSKGLQKREMLDAGGTVRAFATPRRLAALATAVKTGSEPRAVEVKLMPAAVGLDAQGKPTPALQKKLEAAGLAGVDPAGLKRRMDGKSEMLFADARTAAVPLATALQAALDEAIAAIPVPKMMSYQLADGETTVQFARPVHGLLALHGRDVVPVRALGLEAGRSTGGHRFQGQARLEVADADGYESQLERDGAVIADFGKRRARILSQLEESAAASGASLGERGPVDTLLDEVAALVEMPTVYAGAFEREFLEVPAECLVLTMRQNQKYFPLFDAQGKLTERFLIVSNARPQDPSDIVRGNERVVRPRLADARFFFETDKKAKLASRVPQLGAIVYHNKLGTQLQRVDRLVHLATKIQEGLPRGAAGVEWAVRAAYLAKADLVTLMVGEFPELQGLMGRYYAEADGEPSSVCRAIEQHYWPRFAGDRIPTGDASVAVALADKLETIAGMFGIGQQPSGDRDPFALRRHALGVVRILIEAKLDLSLNALVDAAIASFGGKVGNAGAEVVAFILDRARSYLRDMGYSANQVEAVLASNSERLATLPRQLEAVRAFAELPEAQSLAAANKRISNILRQAQQKGEPYGLLSGDFQGEPLEAALYEALRAASAQAAPQLAAGDYTGYLRSFAILRGPVDAFFDGVMVMAEDAPVRRRRLSLLHTMQHEMNRVADIARLAA